jgi:hypothetical protein
MNAGIARLPFQGYNHPFCLAGASLDENTNEAAYTLATAAKANSALAWHHEEGFSYGNEGEI